MDWKEQVEGLKAKYGPLMLVENGVVSILVRTPTRTEFKIFSAAVMDPAKQVFAIEDLGATCVVFPDAKTYDSILDKRPGLAVQVGKAAESLGTGAEEVRTKKL